MMNKNKLLTITFFYFTSFITLKPIDKVINKLDHKSSQLNLYLDLIKYNTQEKMGILSYIIDNPQGIYLEVGTGGDTIAELLFKIPDTATPTIIGSDIDQAILDALPTRHPQLEKYLYHNTNCGPKLELQQLDATNMINFSDDYLDGINASAVVHEIVSYAGGFAGLDKFFAESARVLKANGVLIYRDPEAISDRNELINAFFKTPSIRLFTHIFLVKFLDNTCSSLAKSGRKFKSYQTDCITFTFYKKNEITPCILSYDEYLKIHSYEIDFSRQYSLNLPRGLCREIERHYLTYLHQCNPLVFVKCLPTVDSSSYFVNYLAHSTANIFDEFIQKNGLNISNNLINVKAKRLLDQKITRSMQAIEYGVLLNINTKSKQAQLYNLLRTHNFDPNLYLIQIKQTEFLLDYRIYGLLYDDLNANFFDENHNLINHDDSIHAQWLKREGEETYVYYSDDELITKVAQASLNKYLSYSNQYVLCPISANHNKFIPRLCYDEVLKNSLELTDQAGYQIEIREGKRIIHFRKMLLDNALAIFKEIVATRPKDYSCLNQFINRIQNESK